MILKSSIWKGKKTGYICIQKGKKLIFFSALAQCNAFLLGTGPLYFLPSKSLNREISGAPNLLIRPNLIQRFGRTIRFGRILSPYFRPNQDSAEPNLQYPIPNSSAEPQHLCRISTEPFDISFSIFCRTKRHKMLMNVNYFLSIIHQNVGKFSSKTIKKKKRQNYRSHQ